MVGLLGLSIIAVWITLNLGSGFYLCLASLRWPTAQVRVTSSSIDTGRSNAGRWYEPAVGYEYQVNGRSYRSNVVRFMMPPLYHEEYARDIQASYPQDLETTAAYNPARPGQSVLQPGVPPTMWIRALIPLFFWGLIGYIVFEIKHPERRVLLLRDVEIAGQD